MTQQDSNNTTEVPEWIIETVQSISNKEPVTLSEFLDHIKENGVPQLDDNGFESLIMITRRTELMSWIYTQVNSWMQVNEKAGLTDYDKQYWSNEAVIEEIKLADDMRQTAIDNDYTPEDFIKELYENDYDIPAPKTVEEMFGSWSDAIDQADIDMQP